MPNTIDDPINTAIKHRQPNAYGTSTPKPHRDSRISHITAHPRIFCKTVLSEFLQWRCVFHFIERQSADLSTYAQGMVQFYYHAAEFENNRFASSQEVLPARSRY